MATSAEAPRRSAPKHPHPLDEREVRERVRAGKVNTAVGKESRSVASILRGNILTRFNAIISAMLVVIFVFGEPADAMFGLVMVFNALIGIVQELRAKRTLDRLTVLVAPIATVRRAEGQVELPAQNLVIDDLLVLTRGQQVPVDAVVIESDSLEVSEALLTGEADPILKQDSDHVFSGSFVVAGSALCVVVAVGADSYANQLALEARKFTLARSELAASIDQILRVVTWLLIPTSALLLWSQLQTGQSLAGAAVSTVAGVVAMVPQGLVLLVSMAFAVAVIQLGRLNVLVQELPAVETLARVDVLCVDKTGTLTDGTIALADVHLVNGTTRADADAALSAIVAADPDPNPTMAAIAEVHSARDVGVVVARIPFSSERKLSAIAFDNGPAFVIGAPDAVLDEQGHEQLRSHADAIAASGHRTLVVASTTIDAVRGGQFPELDPLCLLEFEEHLRPDAPETIRYFSDQGVDLKVISGDAPVTAAAIAGAVGIDVTDAIAGADMPDDPERFVDVADRTSVFGRVTPERKRDLVHAFKEQGHVVAMTGDGVNDVLAVKDADLGIAMGAGSGATRAVSQIVLLDNRFSALPMVVAEGRRVVANMERVSSLFLTKTVYATLLAIVIGFVGLAFPFLPRHMTLIGSLTIGIPAFFLSFEPQDTPIRRGFLQRVFAFAIPAGVVTAGATFAVYGVSRLDELGLSLLQSRTAATTLMVVLGLVALYELIEPPEPQHVVMIVVLFAMYVTVLAIPQLRTLFDLTVPRWQAWIVIAIVALIAGVLLKLLWNASSRFISRRYGIDVA